MSYIFYIIRKKERKVQKQIFKNYIFLNNFLNNNKITFLTSLDLIAISDFWMHPLKHILQHDRCEHNSSKVPLCTCTRGLNLCLYMYTCACATRESLIFISKNFFNKKVARFFPPSLPPALCIATGSRTGRCISYIRGRRGRARTPATPDRGALKVSLAARDIS